MKLFQATLFIGQLPKTQTGWNFSCGTLEIVGPNGGTSLCDDIKIKRPYQGFITVREGRLSKGYPRVVTEQEESPDFQDASCLLAIVTEGFLDLSRFPSSNVKMGPKRKKDKSLVLIILRIQRNKPVTIPIKNLGDVKIRQVRISFNGGKLHVKDPKSTSLFARIFGWLNLTQT